MVPYDEHQGCDFKKLLNHTFRFEQLEFEVRTYNDKKREEVLHIITEGMHMNPDSTPPHRTVHLSLHSLTCGFAFALTMTVAAPPAANANHADADCFVCVFLSHGENGHVYAHDDKIEVQDMTSLFRGDKCRSLVGKPKIFILQVNKKLPMSSSSE